MIGKSPFATGRNRKLTDVPRIEGLDKVPGIEIYDHGRFFAMTGWRLSGPREPMESQANIDSVCAGWFPDEPMATTDGGEPSTWRSEEAVIERARKYLSSMPAAVSGQNGHKATFHAACVLVLGFCLQLESAYRLLCEFNERCQPPWSEKELRRKVDEANKQGGERGYLRNTKPERWESIEVPAYSPREAVKQESPRQEQDSGRPRVIQIVDAMSMYLDSVASGESNLLGTSIGQLDYALGGGVARGEMVVVAARPSHGKSAIALQMLHHWTEQGMPCAFLSEEMSTISIGKRVLQFASPIHMEHWGHRQDDLRKAVEKYRELHKPCYVIEQCGSVSRAMRELTELCKDNAVEAIVVDYAQLLASPGKSRYEQVTNTSIAIKGLANATNAVVVLLCQLNRSIETRDSFTPTNADIKDSGQLEQDADVILHLKWPYKVKADEEAPKRRRDTSPKSHGPNEYFIYVGKNRNRQINADRVDLYFDPSRQTIREKKVEEQANYVSDFANWATKSQIDDEPAN
jgi:replicative DNA helicase